MFCQHHGGWTTIKTINLMVSKIKGGVFKGPPAPITINNFLTPKTHLLLHALTFSTVVEGSICSHRWEKRRGRSVTAHPSGWRYSYCPGRSVCRHRRCHLVHDCSCWADVLCRPRAIPKTGVPHVSPFAEGVTAYIGQGHIPAHPRRVLPNEDKRLWMGRVLKITFLSRSFRRCPLGMITPSPPLPPPPALLPTSIIRGAVGGCATASTSAAHIPARTVRRP